MAGAVTEEARRSYLHVRQTEGSLLAGGVSITGNAKALLQLRTQIDRALGGVDEYPLEEAVYEELHGETFEVFVKKARSRADMEPPRQKTRKAEEEVPWGERVRRTETDEEPPHPPP